MPITNVGRPADSPSVYATTTKTTEAVQPSKEHINVKKTPGSRANTVGARPDVRGRQVNEIFGGTKAVHYITKPAPAFDSQQSSLRTVVAVQEAARGWAIEITDLQSHFEAVSTAP